MAYLNIESEVDTDAAPIYNNCENENSTMPSKRASVNQEQKKTIVGSKKKLKNLIGLDAIRSLLGHCIT